MKIAIYSVITGGYDTLQNNINSRGIDHYLFTDSPTIKVPNFYKIYPLKEEIEPKLLSRKVKLNVHQYIPNYDLYIYIDANYRLTKDINQALPILYRPPFSTKDHPSRKDVYQEGERVIKLKKATEEEVIKQLKSYLDHLGPNSGLYENGFFIRENSEQTNSFFEAWYEEVENTTTRDQLSLPYLIHKYNFPIQTFKHHQLKAFARLMPHEMSKAPVPEINPTINIYYFTPASATKNLGKAYNDHCRMVPNDDDWICIRDCDTMFLTPDYAQQIQAIVEKYHQDYDLIGCYTNRIGMKHQLHDKDISEDTDIRNHINIAFLRQNKFYAEVVRSPEYIAGMFMLFPKRIWNAHPFDESGKIMIKKGGKQGFVDYWFTNWIFTNKEGRVGLAKGLYLFHLYRLFHPNPKTHTHLD